MQKFISQKQLYSNFKSVSDEVQKGTTFIVLKYSQPAYKIVPLDEDSSILQRTGTKKQTQCLMDEFSTLQFSSEEKLSENIDNILYN